MLVFFHFGKSAVTIYGRDINRPPCLQHKAGSNRVSVLGLNRVSVLGSNRVSVLGSNRVSVLGSNRVSVLGSNRVRVLGSLERDACS